MRRVCPQSFHSRPHTRAMLCAVAVNALSSLAAVSIRAEQDAQDATEQDSAGQPPERTLKSLQQEKGAGAPDAAPPPPAPKADQQEPRPYVRPVELPGKERHLTLMAVAGGWHHGFNGNTASSSIGPVWGVSGRVEPYAWLGVRLSILRGNQPVSPDANVFVQPGAQMNQPDFEIIHWSIRMEPTWNVTPDLSLWAGVGLAWARAIVPEARTSLDWRTADRACVYVEGQWALGAQYELVRDWVVLSLDLSAGTLGYQKGSAHEPIQAFTPEGRRMHLGAYPDFSRKVQGLFGIGVIL